MNKFVIIEGHLPEHLLDYTYGVVIGRQDNGLLLICRSIKNPKKMFYVEANEDGHIISTDVFCQFRSQTRFWHKAGRKFRSEYSSGNKYWHDNGRLHRTDGPAVEFADGGREWWERGVLVRKVGADGRPPLF